MQQRDRVTIKLATLDVNFAALYSDTVILGVKFYPVSLTRQRVYHTLEISFNVE